MLISERNVGIAILPTAPTVEPASVKCVRTFREEEFKPKGNAGSLAGFIASYYSSIQNRAHSLKTDFGAKLK